MNGNMSAQFNGVNLNEPLDANTQGTLLRQSNHLTAIPEFNKTEGTASKAEKVRAWRREVERKVAALHPVFLEHWNWSWSVAEAFYDYWLRLDPKGRSQLCVTGPIPQRVLWTENWFKDKVVCAMPPRLQAEAKAAERAGLLVSVHGMLCDLFKVYQPGGLPEKQDVLKKLTSPNVCSNPATALNELRNWQAAIRRADEIGMAYPDTGALFMAVVSIYKNVFEALSTNLFLMHKWAAIYNEVDPQQGNNVTLDDIKKLNDFAQGELYALSISNESAASTGLPLTETEKPRRKRRLKRQRQLRPSKLPPTGSSTLPREKVAAKMAVVMAGCLTLTALAERGEERTDPTASLPQPAPGQRFAVSGRQASVRAASDASSSTLGSLCSPRAAR